MILFVMFANFVSVIGGGFLCSTYTAVPELFGLGLALTIINFCSIIALFAKICFEED